MSDNRIIECMERAQYLLGNLIAKIEWSNWIKFMWKFLGVLMIGAIITILIAVGIGF